MINLFYLTGTLLGHVSCRTLLIWISLWAHLVSNCFLVENLVAPQGCISQCVQLCLGVGLHVRGQGEDAAVGGQGHRHRAHVPGRVLAHGRRLPRRQPAEPARRQAEVLRARPLRRRRRRQPQPGDRRHLLRENLRQ